MSFHTSQSIFIKSVVSNVPFAVCTFITGVLDNANVGYSDNFVLFPFSCILLIIVLISLPQCEQSLIGSFHSL